MNKSKKPTIIYLLGAGRSGTTLLATVLNSHPNITTIGEMHQFPEHVIDNKNCSCGNSLSKCSFWQDIIIDLKKKKLNFNMAKCVYLEQESHKKIPLLLFNKKNKSNYLAINEMIYHSVFDKSKTSYLLDSSKYIARFLLLNKSKSFHIKGIYMVRDVRGVIHSFNKKVQTSKKPIVTILYYYLINFFGEIVCRLNSNIIKIKYEDFTQNPEIILTVIYKHVFQNSQKHDIPSKFIMPHIIGGNRLKKNKTIKIQNQHNWKNQFSKTKKNIYYILSFPFMLLNKYKI